MDTTSQFTAFGIMATRIDNTLGGLFVSYLATKERLSRLLETKWFRDDLGRYENKIRMKEVGGAAMQYIFLRPARL